MTLHNFFINRYLHTLDGGGGGGGEGGVNDLFMKFITFPYLRSFALKFKISSHNTALNTAMNLKTKVYIK